MITMTMTTMMTMKITMTMKIMMPKVAGPGSFICLCLYARVWERECVWLCTCGWQWSTWGTSRTCPKSMGLTLMTTRWPAGPPTLLPATAPVSVYTNTIHRHTRRLTAHQLAKYDDTVANVFHMITLKSVHKMPEKPQKYQAHFGRMMSSGNVT